MNSPIFVKNLGKYQYYLPLDDVDDAEHDVSDEAVHGEVLHLRPLEGAMLDVEGHDVCRGMEEEPVAVVHILIAEAYLENAGQDDLLQRVVNKILAAPVSNAGSQLTGYGKVPFLLAEDGQTTKAGEGHAVHMSLHWKINYTLKKNFLRIFLVRN